MTSSQSLTQPPPPLHVLVVENDADNAGSLAMVLHAFGHEVRVARDGAAALEAAQAAAPDVVLLDLGLLVMDGYKVARQLGAPAVPKRPLIIAVSGDGRAEDRRRSHEAGIDLHLVKPADPVGLGCLLERFRSVLRGVVPPPGEA